MRRALVLLQLLLVAAASVAGDARANAVATGQLPAEAREVLSRIQRGGPYRYDRDGAVFGNYERLLPLRGRGYYREYTVDTPGLKHRGARRLVVGCDRDRATDAASNAAFFAGFRGCAGPAEVYYTEDHYRSFRRVLP
jgi:ribonuclease T1